MKSIVVMAAGKNTAIAFREQLYRLLGTSVNIKIYYTGIERPRYIKADVIIFASQEAYNRMHMDVDKKSPMLVARRSINYNEVDKLFEIAPGTDVLLVNDMVSTANQTVALLQTLGIDHINYYSYAPQMINCPHLKTAITPGEKELVPDFVEHVIDIKIRLIDITTLVEILLQLKILNGYADFLSAKYIQDIIYLIKNSVKMIKYNEKVKTQLQTILHTVHDGIVATDEEGNISVVNPVAEQLLDVKSEQVLGMLANCVEQKILRKILQEKAGEKEMLVTVNSKSFILNVAKLHSDLSDAGNVYTFKDVSEIQRLEELVRRKFIKEQKLARYTFSDIAGESLAIQYTLNLASKMALSNSTILIQGESGTGKEIIAQGIHNLSSRAAGPFIAVNFAALTENLLESELFGYIEGAFTGANRGGAPGLFEEAHHGTIFLDEIGDAPLPFQVKLLRVLQEQQIRRVGSAKIIPIDVRVIAATNKDLKQLIRKGKFRQDLYYRLNVLPIKVPPLRDRQEDILLLARNFYQETTNVKILSPEAYFKLLKPYFLQYRWPGNIRELQNVVEYLTNICPDEAPSPNLLPADLQDVCQSDRGDKSVDMVWEQTVFNAIAIANQNNTSIGRRSLAKQLNLPENQVRKLIEILLVKGAIVQYKGRRGLKIAAGLLKKQEIIK